MFHIAIYEAEEGGYWGEVLELPGCASQGETLDELKDNITDAIQACLEVHFEDEGEHARKAISTMSLRVSLPG
jgi:predicted RNase H-like HicB family nuclease